MKGDFSRSTFDRARHYSGVRMQQGRVQVDADWNEHEDIFRHRIETEARDTLGHCGAPWHDAGFEIQVQAGKLFIGTGRYYVDGIPCENDASAAVDITKQPDLPNFPAKPAGTYIAYLDVWSRHITAINDPGIRETALGGPDTATRIRTVWQVKLEDVPAAQANNFTCLSNHAGWASLIAPKAARLRARSKPDATNPDPCIVAGGAGFRRLENQLYRVEVHEPGTANTATFKWSRDNGSVVAAWTGKQVDDLTIKQSVRDHYLRFAAGQWIELIDDTIELGGSTGTLVKIKKVLGDIITIDPATAIPAGPINFASFKGKPRVRRWESDGATLIEVPATNEGYLPLEDGVEVAFEKNVQYNTGDYWLIPARVATGDVEWPLDSADQPLKLPPAGIDHHYCKLAVVKFDGANWSVVSDCRTLFPPVTELTSLHYVGGDGQEAMPDPTQTAKRLALDLPLQAGVSNGKWPLANARVQFEIVSGSGKLQSAGTKVIALTNASGVATCTWEIDSTTQTQQVSAVLLDALGNAVHLPVFFNANLSVASKIAYDPKNCPALTGVTTVQEAIDKLCLTEHKSGGCCVTVGEGGNYPRLDVAIADLIHEKKLLDVCICLMPGDHELKQGLDILGPEENANAQTAERHVRIHGSGLASRISLAGNPFVAKNLGSLMLENLIIRVVDANVNGPIQLHACGLVRIVNCYIAQTQTYTTLLTIANTQQIHIADSMLHSSNWGSQTFNRVAAVSERADETMMMYNAQPMEMDIARDLAKSSSALKSFRTSYKDFASTLAGEEKAFVVDTVKELDAIKVSAASREVNAVTITNILSTMMPSALTIADANAKVTLQNNTIFGELRIFGGATSLPADEFIRFAKSAESLTGTGNDIHLEGNRITRMANGFDLTKLRSNTGVVHSLFERVNLANNTFYSYDNTFIGVHMTLTGNYFQVGYGGYTVGYGVARSLVLTGLSADFGNVIFKHMVKSAPQLFAQAANIMSLQPA